MSLSQFNEARMNGDYISSRSDGCLDEKKRTKKKAPIDPNFKNAIKGFVKKNDPEKEERIRKAKMQGRRG